MKILTASHAYEPFIRPKIPQLKRESYKIIPLLVAGVGLTAAIAEEDKGGRTSTLEERG